VIREGGVSVGGRPLRAGALLRGGERIALPPLEEAVAAAARRARAPRAPPGVVALHRDADLLVVNKPPGVPAHGGALIERGTTLLELLRDDVREGFGLAHRLDRDTSGAIALVRDAPARAAAMRAFAEGESVEKTYDAIVEGAPDPPDGTIDLPLLDPGHGGRARVDPRRGKRAVTDYRTVERFEGASRLSLSPRTGRTHQIRAHLAAIGHPLVVDPLYGARSGWRLVDPKGGPAARLARTPLHCARLSLLHPTTGERVEVAAPLFPDHRRALEVLRIVSGRRPTA
jgi:RluA family pseudouridine synthase